MKILWITNIIFPEAQALLSGNKRELKESGGWMTAASDALVQQPGVHLTIASVSRRIRSLTRLEGDSITFYILPGGFKGNRRVNHGLEKYWALVCDEVKPDIVHIHGTEYTHGLAYLEACDPSNVCVSIQGLVGPCSYYYYYGLTRFEIKRAVTLRSLFRGGILSEYHDFKRRGISEKEIIRRVGHIIGRTQWDYTRTRAINPNAQYHYAGETLRSVFYDHSLWNYSNCLPHSIFLSQASYPLKGLHMVLKAMPIVLRSYPDTILRIAGNDITDSRGLPKRIALSDYGIIIDNMIRKYDLRDHILFTGPLSAQEMKKEYLNTNVFICPSSIENSPNSLCEAQVLGVPVIASYAGGIPDLMHGDEGNLYRYEEFEMLAYKIIHLFKKKEQINNEAMRKKALERHDPLKNVSRLMDIYESIVSSNK